MYDIIIIGGGIVGLATGLRIKEVHGSLKVAIFEKEKVVAAHQTGNNSGVIHSGIYYKPGSLKATNCRIGREMLLDFCNKEGIPYEMCGKIIVATTPAELPRLDAIYERGLENGLTDIRKIGPEEIREREPHAAGLAGIYVPYTGIIDFREVSEKYAEIFTARYDGEILFEHRVTGINKVNGGLEVVTPKGTFATRMVINTAGLQCDRVARFNKPDLNYRIIPFRGEYYTLAPEKHSLVKNLIYPVPDPAFPFLGVHYTRRVKGGIEAGPNAVFAFKREGYKMSDISLRDTFESLTWPGFQKVMWKYMLTGLGEFWRSFNKAAFTKALQKLLPEIRKNHLTPGGAGVRAQICTRDGRLPDDFIIEEDEGIINVLNAPSPAATSSLSIGKTISEMVLKKIGY